MQSLNSRPGISYISLGERRGKSDLAQFSLDLSWARAVSDSARSRAYPSPPMSGSPPLPPRRNPESSDRDHGSYASSGSDVFRGYQTPQREHVEQRGHLLRAYPHDQSSPPSYAPYQMQNMAPSHTPYPQPPQMAPEQQHQYSPRHQLPPSGFSASEGQPREHGPDYTSPKQQRKTKGHVASACVPCKRAHLRCDAQRPCSRCLSNGKEDTCIDVQHKKRGRPRLRDEREPRYEGMGPGYHHPPPGTALRRPISLYTPGDTSMSANYSDALQRSNSYRILKSQGAIGGPIAPRYLDHATQGDANLHAGRIAIQRPPLQSEPVCAYLTMEMQIAKVTQSFGETIGVPSIVSRKFQEIVIPSDLEKILRLQRAFEDERRERDPSYLPPIYLRFEEDRVIQAVGFGPDEMGQTRVDKQEILTFQAADGRPRSLQVRFGLAKKESTYFIVALIHTTAPPQTFQPASPPFPREAYFREAQYGYQTSHQAYVQNPEPSYAGNTGFGDSRGDMTAFKVPGPAGSSAVSSANVPLRAYAQIRPDFSPGPQSYQTPRSEMPERQARHQRDLQLPPIRGKPAEEPMVNPVRRRDDRSGRVDIGGLLEDPKLANQSR